MFIMMQCIAAFTMIYNVLYILFVFYHNYNHFFICSNELQRMGSSYLQVFTVSIKNNNYMIYIKNEKNKRTQHLVFVFVAFIVFNFVVKTIIFVFLLFSHAFSSIIFVYYENSKLNKSNQQLNTLTCMI